jgi:predicted TIM-barrel fold metal-dependent hydrolase
MKKFDVHAHFGPWNSIPIRKWRAADLVALLQAAGIEKAVVSSVQALLADFASGNQATQEAIEQHEMLYGYIYLDPHRPAESIREVEARAGHPKFIGVKSRDIYHGLSYRHPGYREIFAAIKGRRLPALLHTYAVDSMQAAMELASDHDAAIILAHFAGPNWRECEMFAGRQIPGNVYVDPITSMAEPGRYELAVKLFGEDRVVLGTDCSLFHPALAIGAIESSELSEEAKRKVYWDNAQRIFLLQDRERTAAA